MGLCSDECSLAGQEADHGKNFNIGSSSYTVYASFMTTCIELYTAISSFK